MRGVLGHSSHSLTSDQVITPPPVNASVHDIHMYQQHTHTQYITTQCTKTLICLSNVAAAVEDLVFNLIILLSEVSVMLIFILFKWILSVKLHFDNESKIK